MNRLGSVSRPLMWLTAILVAAFAAGCGGGGGDGGSGAAPAPAAAIGNIAGVWAITETEITASAPECAPPGNPLANYPLTVTQTGNDVTVTDASNPSTPTTYSGTLSGDKLTWSGSFPERGGVTTWNTVSTTVAADCNSVSGNATWTYVQDAPAVFSCTGSTTFTGTANTPDGCAVAESAS